MALSDHEQEEGNQEHQPSEAGQPVTAQSSSEPEIEPLSLDLIKRGLSQVEARHDGQGVAFVRLALKGLALKTCAGLEAHDQIRFIDLSVNQLKDLKPLADTCPNLRALAANKNQVSDLSAITALGPVSSLQVVELDQNHVSKIGNLEPLQYLRRLSLRHNQIRHLVGLEAGAELSQLVLSNNHIRYLAGARPLKPRPQHGEHDEEDDEQDEESEDEDASEEEEESSDEEESESEHDESDEEVDSDGEVIERPKKVAPVAPAPPTLSQIKLDEKRTDCVHVTIAGACPGQRFVVEAFVPSNDDGEAGEDSGPQARPKAVRKSVSVPMPEFDDEEESDEDDDEDELDEDALAARQAEKSRLKSEARAALLAPRDIQVRIKNLQPGWVFDVVARQKGVKKSLISAPSNALEIEMPTIAPNTFLQVLDISSQGDEEAEIGALKSLVGIEAFSGLETLLASQNEISSLDGVSQLEHLEQLDIAENQVDDILELHKLQGLTKLRSLRLEDNGLESDLASGDPDDDDYVVELLVRLPQLRVVNGRKVTFAQRDEADELRKERRTEHETALRDVMDEVDQAEPDYDAIDEAIHNAWEHDAAPSLLDSARALKIQLRKGVALTELTDALEEARDADNEDPDFEMIQELITAAAEVDVDGEKVSEARRDLAQLRIDFAGRPLLELLEEQEELEPEEADLEAVDEAIAEAQQNGADPALLTKAREFIAKTKEQIWLDKINTALEPLLESKTATKLVLIGPSSSGKSTVLESLRPESKQKLSLAFDFGVRVHQKQNITLTSWTLRNTTEVDGLVSSFCQQPNAVVLVVDATSSEASLEETSEALADMLDNDKLKFDFLDTPLLILANKSDLLPDQDETEGSDQEESSQSDDGNDVEQASSDNQKSEDDEDRPGKVANKAKSLSLEEISTVLDVDALRKDRQVHFQSVSAASQDGLVEAFEWLAATVANARQEGDESDESDDE